MSADCIFRQPLIMAPMTRGTDLPFRRLLAEYGATVALGEMAYAHKIVRDAGSERVLLRRHPDEKFFGAQLAGKHPQVMAEAAIIAEEQGADFVDVNLGCPIDDATRRGFGAALMQRQKKVREIIAAMKKAVSIPISIKMRLGWSAEKPTFLKIAAAAAEAGVDAITLHGRSRAQRYRRAADWDAVAELAASVKIPVIGNGDIFHWTDAQRRIEETGCAAVMIGRWGLSRPWIFKELAEQREIELDPEERLGVLRRYVELCREAFRDDEKGRRRTRRFLGFHQDFFARYRRGAESAAVNAEDPRNWGLSPSDPLESWLCRVDLPAVEALCDWLVEGTECEPPPLDQEARRAVKTPAYG